MTYADVNRQAMLIFNVLISVLATTAAIWNVGKWWNIHSRLGLSMAGGILVGIAEVVVYFGYIRRLEEARGKEKGVKELKEILQTWVVTSDDHLIPNTSPATEKAPSAVRERRLKSGLT